MKRPRIKKERLKIQSRRMNKMNLIARNRSFSKRRLALGIMNPQSNRRRINPRGNQKRNLLAKNHDLAVQALNR